MRPFPANFGNVAIEAEHVGETASISPPLVIINAAAGSQTKADGLSGS